MFGVSRMREGHCLIWKNLKVLIQNSTRLTVRTVWPNALVSTVNSHCLYGTRNFRETTSWSSNCTFIKPVRLHWVAKWAKRYLADHTWWKLFAQFKWILRILSAMLLGHLLVEFIKQWTSRWSFLWNSFFFYEIRSSSRLKIGDTRLGVLLQDTVRRLSSV